MKTETFFEKFDRIVEPPNAVERLRELIVQLAMRGDLTTSDPADEPVHMNMSENASNNSLPGNWRSGTLGDAIILEYGENLPAVNRSGSGEYPVYGSNGVVGTHDSYLIKEPAIIVGRKGSAGALNIATGPSWDD
jgi:type I restriction enzyme, S subunit